MRDQVKVDFLNSTKHCARRQLNHIHNLTDDFHLEFKSHPLQLAAVKSNLRRKKSGFSDLWFNRNLTFKRQRDTESSRGEKGIVNCLSSFCKLPEPQISTHPSPYTVHGILQARTLEWVSLSPSLGDLPNPEVEPRSPALRAGSLPAEPQGKSKNPGAGGLDLLQGNLPDSGGSCIAGGLFTNGAIREAQAYRTVP